MTGRGSVQDVLLATNGEPAYFGQIALSTTSARLAVPAGTALVLQTDAACRVEFGDVTVVAAGNSFLMDVAPGGSWYVITKYRDVAGYVAAVALSGTGVLRIYRQD